MAVRRLITNISSTDLQRCVCTKSIRWLLSRWLYISHDGFVTKIFQVTPLTVWTLERSVTSGKNNNNNQNKNQQKTPRLCYLPIFVAWPWNIIVHRSRAIMFFHPCYIVFSWWRTMCINYHCFALWQRTYIAVKLPNDNDNSEELSPKSWLMVVKICCDLQSIVHGVMGCRIDPLWCTHWAISRSSQCSMTGETKAVVCAILFVGCCI